MVQAIQADQRVVAEVGVERAERGEQAKEVQVRPGAVTERPQGDRGVITQPIGQGLEVGIRQGMAELHHFAPRIQRTQHLVGER